MKNEKLLKVLGLSLLFVIALTWLIPGSSIGMENILERGKVEPMGLMEIFGSFEILMVYFFQNSIFILLVGALYGVMNKTGAYKNLVDSVTSLVKGNENILLMITTALFILLPGITNLYFPLFVLIPLFISLLLGVGYSKKTSLLATVGALLIGMSCNLSSELFRQISQTEGNVYFWIKVGYLVVAMVITVLFALKTSKVVKSTKKKSEEKKEETIIVPEKRNAENKIKVNKVPLLIVFTLMFALIILGLVSWNTSIFIDFHRNVMEASIGEFTIFANIFGPFGAFGTWSYNELYVLLIITSIVIGLIYRLNLKEIVEGMIEGGRKFVSIAIIILLLNLFIIFTINSGFFGTIIDWIASSGNTALISLTTIIGAPLMIDQVYAAQYNMSIIIQVIGDSANVDLIAFITQITYGITMLVAPTSAALVAGLLYLEENYIDWVKHIWRLALILLLGGFIAITIASLI